jgi:hypothetical protein
MMPEVITYIAFVKSARKNDIFNELEKASASSMGFWDNPIDDEVWNNVIFGVKSRKISRDRAGVNRKSDLLLSPTMNTKAWKFNREEANERRISDSAVKPRVYGGKHKMDCPHP